MVKAFIGINIEAGEKSYGDWTGLTNLKDKFDSIKGITEVYLILGRFDLMIVVNVETLEEINNLVWEKIRAMVGVKSTETFIVSA